MVTTVVTEQVEVRVEEELDDLCRHHTIVIYFTRPAWAICRLCGTKWLEE